MTEGQPSGMLHHERIRAYLDAFPNMVAVGNQMAYDRDYQGPGWPYRFYSLNRHDLQVVLAQRERVIEALGVALEHASSEVYDRLMGVLTRPLEGQIKCTCGRAWWDLPAGHSETGCEAADDKNEVETRA